MKLRKWTLAQYYAGERWDEYYSAGVDQHRDSDCLERSNFECMLKALGGESETVVVVHERHCLVGWCEWIAIHSSDHRSLEIADELVGQLENYPVLDEEHWSEMEYEEAQQVWRDCYDWRERIQYIRGGEFHFDEWKDMMGCVRGHYFMGYPSELLDG